MAESLGFNVRITGDASNFEKSINDAAAAIETQSKKSVKALKDQRDAYGVLRDEQGRIVEGLSKWQRALGYYVDELGTVRTANDRFVDGLTTVQKKIGLEVDDLGNIYNKLGEVVGNTGKGLKAFSDAEKGAATNTEDLKAALENAINGALSGNIEKMQRDLLSMTGAFAKVKGGFDALFGSNSGISKAVDSIGKVTNAVIGFKQAGESIAQALGTVKEFAAGLRTAAAQGKGLTAISANLSGVQKSAQGATGALGTMGSSLATLTTGVGVFVAAYGLLAAAFDKFGGETFIDPEKQKAVEDYADQFKQLEARARAAGAEIKNVSDALRVGALSGGNQGTELDAILADWKETLQSGLSSRARAEIRDETQIFGDTLTAGLVKFFSSLGMGDANDVEKERRAVIGAINAKVKEIAEREKTQSEKILEQAHDLESALDYIDDPEQYAQVKTAIDKLLTQYDKEIEKEKKAAAAEARRQAGLDKYIKAQDAAEITLDNARAKFAEWADLAQQGTVNWREYQEATNAAAKDLRQKLGVQNNGFQEEYNKALDQYNNLIKAIQAGIISQTEGAEAWKNAQKQAAATLAQKYGLTLDDDKEALSLNDLEAEIKQRLDAGMISADEAQALRDAFKKRAAAELAAAQGVDLDAEKKLAQRQKTTAQKLEDWRKKLAAGEVTQAQFNAAQKALTEETKKRLADLAKETGVKLPGDKETASSSIARDYQEAVDKWKEALKNGEVTQKQYNDALKQLADKARQQYEEQRDAGDAVAQAEREYARRVKELAELAKAGIIDEKERRAQEKQAREKRDATIKEAKTDPAAKAALDSLKQQADALKRQTTWQDDLKTQLDAVRNAHKKGLITLAEMNEAEALYTRVKKQKIKQEQAEAQRQARDAARSELGVDSILESMKTPLQKFAETIDKLNDAAGFLTMEEYAAIYQNAVKEFAEANQTAVETMTEGAVDSGKRTAGASITAGSDTFYKALVESMAPGNYEATMKDTTKRIYDATAAGNSIAQDGNALLLQIAQAVENAGGIGAGVAVFGG